jgi:hypothetical protein
VLPDALLVFLPLPSFLRSDLCSQLCHLLLKVLGKDPAVLVGVVQVIFLLIEPAVQRLEFARGNEGAGAGRSIILGGCGHRRVVLLSLYLGPHERAEVQELLSSTRHAAVVRNRAVVQVAFSFAEEPLQLG